MSLERGLDILTSNYYIVDKKQDDRQVIVATLALIQSAEIIALSREGWEVQGHVATFRLPQDIKAPEFEELPPTESPPEQPDSTETQ